MNYEQEIINLKKSTQKKNGKISEGEGLSIWDADSGGFPLIRHLLRKCHLLLKEKAFLGGKLAYLPVGWLAMTIGMMGHPP